MIPYYLLIDMLHTWDNHMDPYTWVWIKFKPLWIPMGPQILVYV